jgi:hypothetical protein
MMLSTVDRRLTDVDIIHCFIDIRLFPINQQQHTTVLASGTRQQPQSLASFHKRIPLETGNIYIPDDMLATARGSSCSKYRFPITPYHSFKYLLHESTFVLPFATETNQTALVCPIHWHSVL